MTLNLLFFAHQLHKIKCHTCSFLAPNVSWHSVQLFQEMSPVSIKAACLFLTAQPAFTW